MLRNLLVGLIGLFLVTSLLKNYNEYQKNTLFYTTLNNDLEKEKNRNNNLRMQKIKESDRLELEKTIRNKLNLVRENEIAIIVPTPTLEPTIIRPTSAPVYKQWLHIFLKN